MYKNNEGYPDPTAGEAYANIRRFEKRQKEKNHLGYIKWVYVCSPYRGDVKANVYRALSYSRKVVKQGFLPITPHIYLTRFLDDDNKKERDTGLYLGLQLLKRCNELWVFGKTISEGMLKEINYAKKHDIPVKYYDACSEVTN